MLYTEVIVSCEIDDGRATANSSNSGVTLRGPSILTGPKYDPLVDGDAYEGK